MPVKTLITGTVQDPSGSVATSGYVRFKLSPGSSSQAYRINGTTILAPMEVRAGIDSSGQIKASNLTDAFELWGNDLITPANTSYDVTYAPAGEEVQTIRQVLISGSAYDMANPIFMPSVSLPSHSLELFGDALESNLVPLTGGVFVVGTAEKTFSEGHFDNLTADSITLLNPIQSDSIALQASTKAALPLSQAVGTLARVTDDIRGIWMRSQTGWFHINHRQIDAAMDFGADPTFVNDSADALDAAFAKTGYVVYVPSGVYKLSRGLATPRCAAIIGSGGLVRSTTLQPVYTGADVVLPLDGDSPRQITGLRFKGDTTNGAKAIEIGTVSNYEGVLTDMFVENFGGAGAVGIHFNQCINTVLFFPYVNNCYVDLLFENTVPGSLPTTIQMFGGAIREADTKGVKITTGYTINAWGTIFESNTEEGVFVEPLGNILDLHWIGGWFESNYLNDTTNYQFKINGTASGDIRWSIRDTYFAGSALKAKSINVDDNGFFITSGLLDNVQIEQSIANLIRVDSSRQTIIANWPNNLDYATQLLDVQGTCYNVIARQQAEEAQWTSWTPTFSSDIGNSAATWGVVPAGANLYCQYKKVGKTFSCQVFFSGTIKAATTPLSVRMSLPAGMLAKNDNTYATALITNNNTQESGWLRAFISNDINGSSLYVSRLTGVVFTANAPMLAAFSWTFEIA